MLEPTPKAIEYVEACRTYKGVKFRHQGRNRNGMDCVGLVLRGALDVGCATGAEAIGGYARMPGNADFDKWCSKFTNALPYNRLQPIVRQVAPGDLISFWIDTPGHARHIAAFTGIDGQGRPTMIHSYAKEERGVVEMPIDPNYWTRRVSRIYRIKELF